MKTKDKITQSKHISRELFTYCLNKYEITIKDEIIYIYNDKNYEISLINTEHELFKWVCPYCENKYNNVFHAIKCAEDCKKTLKNIYNIDVPILKLRSE